MFGPGGPSRWARPPAGYGYTPSYGGPSTRRRDPFFYLLLLQLLQRIHELPWKPPATLAVMALNVAIYFRSELLPSDLADLVPSVQEGALQPARVVLGGEWSRLLWAGFLHLTDTHLVYNMSSLLMKGAQLEQRMGSLKFAGLLGELLVVSHTLAAVCCTWLGESFPNMRRLSRGPGAVGFSAVLFALKYILTWNEPGFSQPMGLAIVLPTKYLAWAELILIHWLVPGTSFTGHLAGVAAGWLHVHVFSHLPGALTRLWRSIARGLPLGGGSGAGQPRFARADPGARASSRVAAGGGGGAAAASTQQQQEQQGRQQQQQQQQQRSQGGSSRQMTEEEVRQARLARFDRPAGGRS